MKRQTLALAALLAACGSSDKHAAEPAQGDDPAPTAEAAPAAAGEVEPDKPEWKTMGDRAVALFRKLHGVVVKNKGDCDTMATGLESLVDDNEAFIAEARGFKADVAFTRWFDHTYGPELAVLAQELGPVLQGCAANPKVKAAVMRFEGPPRTKAGSRTQ